jgi:hypothetical protein
MALDRNVLKGIRAFACLILAVLCLLLLPNRYAFGQVDEGSITGTVQDASGAVVPNASVTLLNTDQGTTLQTKTDSSGLYTFSPVRIGHYSISVTAKGFAKTTQQNLMVNVSQNLMVNIQLKLGAATETIEVTTAPPLLQTEDASVGQVVSEQTVNNLPLNGRNFTFLAQLGAGAQTPQADTRGNAASGAFSANGLRPAQNNYLLDGIDDNSNAVDFLNGTNYVILPPVDAIQEFKVQTGQFSAELGRSAGAVLNATIKSGTNSLHGDVWEFFRNDKLDAADWFEQSGKGELRLNQFGGTVGGRIIKNKLFFFGDIESKRRVQGNTQSGLSVPTALERSSSYTNLSEIYIPPSIATPAQTDALGRLIPQGTVLDPATTRGLGCGQNDPVSGRPGPACPIGVTTGTIVAYVRDPFGTCSASTASFTLTACGLNQIPSGRIDSKAVALLNLFPAPKTTGVSSNYHSSPNLFEHSTSFDTRVDYNVTEKDQAFARFSYVDDPQYIPGPFGGVADGGAFQQGIQTAKSAQMVAAYTHVFSPATVNVARGGFAHLHTTRFGPDGSVMNVPSTYGIQGIPQVAENGGLPQFTFGGLSTLGSNNFLPSDEISQTLQITDDFTKIYGKHSFKMGLEYQHVKFSTLQPAWSRGDFGYDGRFTDVVDNNTSTTGIAQFLMPPALVTANSEGETIANGINYSGGANEVYASNINKTYDAKTYLASYFQDDWKMTPKLTLNLGLRWDYFGPINETNGGQANFVPYGPPDNSPEYIIPLTGKSETAVTAAGGMNSSLATLLNTDHITLVQTDKYGKGLVQTQKYNFAPRVGFAYQVNPKLVVRGGFGLFFNSFENQGYGPNIGENYPFVYNFHYTPVGADNSVYPVSANTPFTNANCQTGGTPSTSQTAVFETAYSCIPFAPSQVEASGLALEGLQFNYQTPRSFETNLTVQYSLTRTLSVQAAYVFTDSSDLQAGVSANTVTAILPKGHSTTDSIASGNNEVPFPDFGQGSSYYATVGHSNYNGLQTKLEQQFNNGLTFLLAYTWSKTMSDAGDELNGGSVGGYRAPNVPGLGPKFDWGLADFDIRQVLHFSGGYQLPFGKNKRFLNQGGLANAIVGGWSGNWILTMQGGQPITLSCPTGTTAGTNCNDLKVAGQSQKLGKTIRTAVGAPPGTHPEPFWFGNPAAFAQPCEDGNPSLPTGCVAQTGTGYLGGGPSTTTGPGFHRLDVSAFKAFQLTNRFSAQFRAEFFNVLNHPNFNAPNFGGNGVIAISGSGNFTNPNFGEIGSTRDAPFDPRQIQFALKLYY